MSLGEFDIIHKYFTHATQHPEQILLSVGDDAAVVRAPAGYDCAIAIDTLNAGVHFPLDTSPYDIGWKALAVNLSDMAAMGAIPAWFTLALSMPQTDAGWLEQFANGLFALAQQYQVDLIGGDTTRGPLSVTIQIGGWVHQQKYLTRSGAQAGDGIYVTGELGDAALALALLKSNQLQPTDDTAMLNRLNRPVPRVLAGQQLVGLASACIDISDGLSADLGHILESSGVGARIKTAAIPMSTTLRQRSASGAQALGYGLFGGDDYELCFTVPPAAEAQLLALSAALDCRITRIGEITGETGLWLVDANGVADRLAMRGYQHFQSNGNST